MKLELGQKIIGVGLVLVLVYAVFTAGDRDLIPVQLDLTRSLSKLPFVIAADQGLYEKYGLDVEIRMRPPRFEGGIHKPSEFLAARVWRRLRYGGRQGGPWHPDIFVDGHTPAIVKLMNDARAPHMVAIAGTDCVLRAHIVGASGITSLDDLRGKSVGISSRTDATTGFGALTLAGRMGWDPVQDMSIKVNGHSIEALETGQVDAIVASEVTYSLAVQRDFPILADTRAWDVALAGNSVMVKAGWLDDDTNRDIARRFLMATIEAHALFHTDRALALRVMAKWNGVSDAEIANTIYERGQWLARKPYACHEGIDNTLAMYDSHAMRQFRAEDFFDDSLVSELDKSGFIDGFYE